MNIEVALQILKDNGYKYTDKREKLVHIFAQDERYMSAKEVLRAIQEDFPQLSFDTIYRNLSLFESLNILEATEMNGERLFRFQCHAHDHHHHLICLCCGKNVRIDGGCPMDGVKSLPEHFKITGHKFEIYGYCSGCQE
jgi:Fur family zinc uptake transcriptional regulator